jgi:hypothetical protein
LQEALAALPAATAEGGDGALHGGDGVPHGGAAARPDGAPRP